MKVIGLTGKACTGKNIVAKELEKNGFYVIDVDELGHLALEENKAKIVKIFGNILDSNGKVDRKKLGNIVFSSSVSLRQLESILHPGIKTICKRIIDDEKKGLKRNIVINAAILQRGKLTELCDEYIFVKSSLLIRYRRTKERDKRGLIWFLKRNYAQRDIKVNSQMKEKGVFLINNGKGINEICRQVCIYCGILNKRHL